MKKILILIILFISFSSLKAQLYKNSYGLKLGWIAGVSAKHFFDEKKAIEGNIDIQKKGFILTGTFQYNFDVKKIETFKWFLGGGGHFGLWDKSVTWINLKEPVYIGGITFIAGIEYRLPGLPLSFSLDLDPRYNLFGEKIFWAYGGLTIRYVIDYPSEDDISL
jgi:hypothetical protein